MTEERHTNVAIEARGVGNVFRVTVVGTFGRFEGVRKTFHEGRTTAIKYARLLDAPRSVLDDGREVGDFGCRPRAHERTARCRGYCRATPGPCSGETA